MVNQLIEILGREAALFESFLELLELQKERLVANDLEGIKEVTSQQQQTLTQTAELSLTREELIEKIRLQNEIEGDLTVTRLLEIVEQEHVGPLSQLRDTILSLNDKIVETRNSNAMLVNSSRQVISKTMNALAKVNSPEPTYSPGQKPATRESSIMVDRRV